MIKAVFNAVQNVDDVILVVKPHPNESEKELNKLIKPFKKIVMYKGSDNIVSLIKCSDLFVTMFSTTTIHALCLGKPIINIDFPSSNFVNSPFIKNSVTRVAKSKQEIECHIKSLINPTDKDKIYNEKMFKKRAKFLKDQVHLLDGKASERVVKYIENILI